MSTHKIYFDPKINQNFLLNNPFTIWTYDLLHHEKHAYIILSPLYGKTGVYRGIH